jgi:hypothetical protein
MGLKYSQTKNDEGEDFASFKLAAGTTFSLGSETVELPVDTDVFIRGIRSRDAVVETIVAAGQAGPNAKNFAYTEEIDGEKVAVTYGGFGQRRETPIEPEPEAGPAPKSLKAAPKKPAAAKPAAKKPAAKKK